MHRILACMTLALLPQLAWADAEYACRVTDFKTFSDDDKAFVFGNLDKKFHLIIRDDEVLVSISSPKFEDTLDIFKRGYNTLIDQYWHDETSVSLSTLATPTDPARVVELEGSFQATMVYHANFIANSWLLNCTPSM